MSELEGFFAEVEPFLFGESSVDQLQDALGPSRSGRENLDFYRILITRNFNKILGELFAPVRALTERLHPGLWPELVRSYAAAQRSDARDVAWAGEGFSEFLAQRRAEHPEQSALLEELADYAFCRFAAFTAPDAYPDEDRDGFEQRLFVRMYTFPLPKLFRALLRDPQGAEIPTERGSTLLVYRTLDDDLGHSAGVRWHRPTLAQLAALGRRQGVGLPPALADLPQSQVDDALAQLISLGVLTG